MDIYLAARFSRQEELRAHREILTALGHEVTSRWLDRIEEERDDLHASSNLGDAYAHGEIATWAIEDFADVCRSNCVIYFAPGGRRGGCHVELGMGIALGIRNIVVGERENCFHRLPQVEHFDDFGAMVAKFLTEPENGYVWPSTVLRSSLDLL